MKEFIYLDTDYLTSALAQINDGKIISISDEQSNANEKEFSKQKFGVKNNTKISINFASIFGIENNTEIKKGDIENVMASTEATKQIFTKMVDDNILDIFLNYLISEELLKSQYKENDFIFIEDEYRMFDFDFVLSFYSEIFVEWLIENDIKVLRQENPNVNQAGITALKKKQRKVYEQSRKGVERFKLISPSNCIFSCKEIVAPLKKEFIRGEYRDIFFRYNCKIKFLAKITRKFSLGTVSPDEKRTIDTIYEMNNKLFQDIMYKGGIDISDSTYIATPIAIYIE